MQIGRVKGTVVSTNKADRLQGMKLMLVKPIDIATFEEKGDVLIATDVIGAGSGDVVMLVGGSSSQQTEMTKSKPVDQTIVAIIDSVDVHGKKLFVK